MASIEKTIKAQFARVFREADWQLFKALGESNLKEAAEVRSGDMRIRGALRLLARNSRKRLLIGVGVELLLKAIYLKSGYAINKPDRDKNLRFPLLARDAARAVLSTDVTFTLNELIEKLPVVADLSDPEGAMRGLRIAKVLRNKEGHGVTSTHKFDASNYTDIAYALSVLYRDVFHEELSIRFSMAPNEKAVWRLRKVQG